MMTAKMLATMKMIKGDKGEKIRMDLQLGCMQRLPLGAFSLPATFLTDRNESKCDLYHAASGGSVPRGFRFPS